MAKSQRIRGRGQNNCPQDGPDFINLGGGYRKLPLPSEAHPDAQHWVPIVTICFLAHMQKDGAFISAIWLLVFEIFGDKIYYFTSRGGGYRMIPSHP